MKSIAAGKLKNACLEFLVNVARTLIPYVRIERPVSLAGSIVREEGDLYSTGEPWTIDTTGDPRT